MRVKKTVRKPQQARSIRSTARMLDAAEAVFAEGGADALTVDAVVERAETSIGNFYGRFGDRDGLLQAMHERFLERLGGATQAAVGAASSEPTLAGAIEVFLTRVVATVHEHRNSARFFVFHQSGDKALRAQGIQANAMFAAIFKTLVLRYRTEIGHSRPATAADVAWRLTFATIVQQVMFDNQEVGDVPMAGKPLIREITRCLVAYLKSPGAKA
jgi:AcrR family transcriptional regulator